MSRLGRPIGANEIPAHTKFGERLRELRHAKGLSQEMLAAMCGFSGGEQIGRYELGKEYPRVQSLGWIAMALGFDDMGPFFQGINPEDLI